MTAGQLLREARERHGLTQRQLAIRARTSQAAISRIERGLVSPTIETLEKLLAPARVLRGLLASLRPGGGPAPLPELTLANLGGSMFDFFNRLWKGTRDGRAARPGPAATHNRE